MKRSFSANLRPHMDPDKPIPSRYLHKDYIIYHALSMERLATDLASSLVRHSSIGCSIGKIRWGKFNDGFPNIFVEGSQELVDRDVIFIASFDNPGCIFSQLSVCYMLSTWRARSLTIILPYSPVATMERSSNHGEIVTAATLARMFGMISMSCELLMVDLHTWHNLHYFPNHIYPVFVHSAHQMKKKILSGTEEEIANAVFTFPDEGAYKRYTNVIKPFPAVICSKIRQGDKRIICVTQGQEYINNKDLYIVDDLVHSGGTLLNTIAALRAEYTPKSINLFITHGIFENDTWKPFVKLHEEGIIKTFYLCDTTPMAVALDGKGPFKVLSIADDLAEIIYHNKQMTFEKVSKHDHNCTSNEEYHTESTKDTECPHCASLNEYYAHHKNVSPQSNSYYDVATIPLSQSPSGFVSPHSTLIDANVPPSVSSNNH